MYRHQSKVAARLASLNHQCSASGSCGLKPWDSKNLSLGRWLPLLTMSAAIFGRSGYSMVQTLSTVRPSFCRRLPGRYQGFFPCSRRRTSEYDKNVVGSSGLTSRCEIAAARTRRIFSAGCGGRETCPIGFLHYHNSPRKARCWRVAESSSGSASDARCAVFNASTAVARRANSCCNEIGGRPDTSQASQGSHQIVPPSAQSVRRRMYEGVVFAVSGK